ncbi:hypothetical protein D3C81_604380 [compost metagenome]
MLKAFTSTDKALLSRFKYVSSYSIPNDIVKKSDSRHLPGLVLIRSLMRRKLGLHNPAFPNHEQGRINRIQSPADLVHGIHVQETHKIEPEAVHMVFLSPMEDRLDNELGHHFPFRGHIISTTRAIREFLLTVITKVITGYELGEINNISIVDMIVYHVHNDAKTMIVQSLNQLFQLANTNFRLIRICRVGAFRNVVIFRVITPIILGNIKAGLVHTLG